MTTEVALTWALHLRGVRGASGKIGWLYSFDATPLLKRIDHTMSYASCVVPMPALCPRLDAKDFQQQITMRSENDYTNNSEIFVCVTDVRAIGKGIRIEFLCVIIVHK